MGIEKKELASNEVLLDSMLFRLIQISKILRSYLQNVEIIINKYLGMKYQDLEIELFMIMVMLMFKLFTMQ